MTSDKKQTFRYLCERGYSVSGIIKFLLDESGYTLKAIAGQEGVSAALVSKVISGERQSTKVKSAICEALGFDPWA